ncbi:histidinol phosphatase [Vibrio alginolyticus]|uniref:TrlF family AAA-like ATPase n=1 Tax=Vibrio alginolyticus TaxID=663 RepID=UPI0006CA805C|nr:AAA family ATPase [Vibrio alginolyticus]EGR2556679.1 histidinol phosphatase [Vibrio alginolyticus]EJV5739936.1 AAA family ATPase [Vibrio alginolyticus]KPM91631.1 hypothetical protein AOR10_16120 [Vibrio alginolyticus]MCR9454715.1 AAA family ATPase [Vibrio alginolyticus]MCR9463156.1 AAA family ATPase [Vibrio alginolyticus]
MPAANITNKWYKFDFHTHTPESRDYREASSPEPELWLRTAMERALDCIAITDHNSGGWIDRLKATYEQIKSEEWFRPLVIFPGVEITISLGASRIHLLAIFDPSKSTQDLTRFLGSCDLQGDFGDPEACYTTQSIETIVKKIAESNGVAIPAHIDAPKGLLHEVTNTNPDIKAHLTLFDGAQFVDRDYLSSDSIHEELKRDASHLATVMGSDAHTLAAIGGSYSWIKMGTPSIEALNFALKDHQFCILNQAENPNNLPRSYIESLEIGGMKHCGMNPTNIPKFQLHPLFNSIIGGRGTGKSTFIESLRLSLGRSQELDDLPSVGADVQSFVDGVTTDRTLIEARFVRNTSSYRVSWTKEGGVKFERADEGGWVVDEGDVSERFAVNIYSQKQINALASNPTSLLELVDRSPIVDIESWNSRFEPHQRLYMELSSEEVQLSRNISKEGSKNSRLQELMSDINGFESGGHSQVLIRNQLMTTSSRLLSNAGNIDDISNSFDELLQETVPSLNTTQIELLEDPLKEELVAIQSAFETEVNEVLGQIETLKTRIVRAKELRDQAIQSSNWHTQKVLSDERYQDLVSEYQERGSEFNTQEYESWTSEKVRIEQQLECIEVDKARLSEVSAQKEGVLNTMLELRRELQTKRQEFIDSILINNDYVQMTIRPFSDLSKAERQFRTIVGHDRFSSSVYEEGNDTSLLYGLFNASSTFEEKASALGELKSAIKSLVLGEQPNGYRIDRRFMDFLTERYEREPEFMARLDCWQPDDLLEVKYSPRGDGTHFASISRGSAGQKAAAILAFLLSHGEEPIIIDQPEDDLDNALVYSLIVNQIQNNKARRQIIIVTHNPNIVVNGDAELVNVMEFRGGQVQIKASGSLIEQHIRDEVCEIMEGGREAFSKRFHRISRL